jgi:hypothetical protein
MKHIFMLAGAAALAFAGPAVAKPGGGHGNPHGHGYGYEDHGKGKLYGYGIGGCPPGLAKKGNGCMPPGQARKLYRVGQRFPLSYGNRWSFSQIPYDIRSRYGFDRDDRYYYGDGYIYRVNPRTMLIEQVVSALLYR